MTLRFERRIGIIGIGKMGEALISGLIRSKFTDRAKIGACDVSVERIGHVSKKYQITCYSDNRRLVENSDIVVIAVQPRDMKTVLEDIREELTSKHLLISIAAGISTSFILRNLQKKVSLIRAMPNNPCTIGEGMTALAPTPKASEEDIKDAKEIFGSVGRVIVLDEGHFDAVTGLSGSGPAYVYLFIEALADGGVKVGLPKGTAILLAAQTLLGSAKMVLETMERPERLKDMVATPGGTTVSGLFELEAGKVRASVIRAVEKATQRAKELETE